MRRPSYLYQLRGYGSASTNSSNARANAAHLAYKSTGCLTSVMSMTGHCRRRAARRSHETTCGRRARQREDSRPRRGVCTRLHRALPRRQQMRLGVPLHDQAPRRVREVARRRLECLSARRKLSAHACCTTATARASQKDSSSSRRFRLVTSGQLRSPCGLRNAVRQHQGSRASFGELCAPVELPVAGGLLLSEEVA
jgi:hypothetical protein